MDLAAGKQKVGVFGGYPVHLGLKDIQKDTKASLGGGYPSSANGLSQNRPRVGLCFKGSNREANHFGVTTVDGQNSFRTT